eukprot:1144603-Pelagomonas_calceolata.AAC.1
MGDLTRLNSDLYTHNKCFHNTVDFKEQKGQGVAIYIHNSLHDLVRIWKEKLFWEQSTRVTRVTREKRPPSKRLTASLFINTHEVMKEKRKFVVIL